MKRFEGLERGKDFQICPNSDCETSVQLQDGCNHLVCSACGTNFCYICGGEADAESGHWQIGKPCPRYNSPQDRNAGFDNAELQARLAAVFNERLLAERVARELREDEERWQSIDMLFDTIGREEYERRIAEVVNLLDDVPGLPDLTGMTDEAQLAAENALAPELEAPPLGRVMLQNQRELDTMIELAEMHLQEAEDEDLAPPLWAELAVELMTDLRQNLDLYVYRIRLRVHFDDFDARQDNLEMAHGPHQAEIFRHFQRFYEILVAYATVAEIRLMVAADELEAADELAHEQEFAELNQHQRGLEEVMAEARQLIAEAARDEEAQRLVREVEEGLRLAEQAVGRADGLRRAQVMQAARQWLDLAGQAEDAAAAEEDE